MQLDRTAIRWWPRLERLSGPIIKRNGHRAQPNPTMTKSSSQYEMTCMALHDATADQHDMLRIVDESGEDYLYPKALFRAIAVPQAVKRAVLAA